MNGIMSRMVQIVVILVLLASSFGVSGCNNSGPTPPISVDLSFPNGAPPLNQATELRCVVKTDVSADNVTVKFNLPDGLQFVSGNLSAHFGSIVRGDVKELKAVVKPVKTGNYTIEAKLSLVSLDPGFSLGPGRHQIYLSVSENSAEWGIYPPWIKPPPSTPTPKNQPTPPPISPNRSEVTSPNNSPSTPISVELLFPNGAPRWNQTAELRCVVKTAISADNVTVEFNLPDGLQLVSDNISANFGSVSKGDLRELKAVVKPVKTGNYTIEAKLSLVSPDPGFSLGPGTYKIYLSVSENSTQWGIYPPWIENHFDPWKLVQTVKGDKDAVPLTEAQKRTIEEAVLKGRPSPPAVSLNGTVEKSGAHHSITLTGTLRYFTKLGDYRDYPNTPVAAKWFLVEIVDANGAHLAYGYTNDYGDFSIPGINPSGGMVVRMWCYIKYSPYNYELRVVQSGNSLTELTDVYYFDYTGVFYYPDDGQTHGVGQIDLPLGIYGDGACWIKDDLDRAFRYVYLHTPNQPGPATVRWTENSGDGDHWDPLLNQIHLTGEAEKAPDTVIHEYGHQVMANIYGIINYPPYLPLTHYIYQSCGSNCAWAEGWADFFPLVVNGNSVFTWADGSSTNLEVYKWNSPGWDNGDSVEGRVAGTLWDIFDSDTDGFDTYYDGFDEIWDTFASQTDNTFSQFYDAWKQRSHNQQEFLACAYQNTIVYDTVTLEQALDTSGLTWTTGGNGNWFGEKFKFFNDGDAAQSSAITHNQETWIKTNITGPGTVKFYWKVSSEPNYDFLRFYIDGNAQDSISSDVDWQQKQYPVSSGSHELMWKYIKDGSISSLCDCGWLDKVEWIPNNPTQKLIGADLNSGYTGVASGGYFALAQFTAETSGTITELRVKCASDGNIKVAVYSDNNGEPGNLLPNAFITSTPVNDNLNIICFPSTYVIAGQKYWLARNSDSNILCYKTQPGSYFRYKAASFSGFSFPSSAGTGFSSDAQGYHLVAGWGVTTQKLIGVAEGTSFTGNNFQNHVSLCKFTAESSGTINSIKVMCSGIGNVKVALYADSSGEPGTLLSAVNTSTPVNLGWNQISLVSPVTVYSGTSYWLAVACDSSGVLYWHSGGGTQRYAPITFESYTFPHPAGAGYSSNSNYVFVAGWGIPGTNTQKLIGADVNSGHTGVASEEFFALAQFTAETNGTISELRVKCASSGNIMLAIYSDNNGEPGNLLPNAFITSTPVNDNLNIICFPSTYVIASQKYWLARNSDADILCYQSQLGAQFRYKAATFNGFSFPTSAGTGFDSDPGYHLVAGWGIP